MSNIKTAKYELVLSHSIERFGRTLYRIRALRDIDEIGVKRNQLGGYVESVFNLAQDGLCWIFNDA